MHIRATKQIPKYCDRVNAGNYFNKRIGERQGSFSLIFLVSEARFCKNMHNMYNP
jgi:hypothetical protein